MEFIRLNSGGAMPMIGLGTWQLRGKEGKTSILAALEAGYRLLDTAQLYENEEIVGAAVRESGIAREALFLTTKLSRACATEEETLRSIEDSLGRLGQDYVDLLLLHEPYETDAVMYRAMEKAVRRGLVRAIGVSNYQPEELQPLLSRAEIRPAVDQAESHVFNMRRQTKQKLEAQGIVLQSWAPFAEGKKDIFRNPVLLRIGERYGKTAAQVALRVLVQNGIPVIPKSSHPERMRENLALFDFALTGEELRAAAGLDEKHSLFGWD